MSVSCTQPETVAVGGNRQRPAATKGYGKSAMESTFSTVRDRPKPCDGAFDSPGGRTLTGAIIASMASRQASIELFDYMI